MEQQTLTPHELALLLFSGELAGGDELLDTVQRTFGKLGLHLSQRLGSGGYHALLKRAVTLAVADFPWLAAVQVTDNGDLAGFGSASKARTVSEKAAGGVAILASLIGLLETFIGRRLCLRVLHAVWPDVVGIALKSSHGDNDG